MEKPTIIYCYRMTHDYGINPCVFTEDYEPTPHLLTEGGCMTKIRRGIYNEWAAKLHEDAVDIYLLAIAGHSNDGGRYKDKHGSFISPKYQHLMFVAKISDVISRKEYLESELSKGRLDALAYYKWWDNQGVDDNEKVLLSHKFSYYGGEPREIPEEILKFFPKGVGHRKWDTEVNKDYLAPLLMMINDSLSGENHINQPYHPMKA